VSLIKVKDALVYIGEQERRFENLMKRLDEEKTTIIEREVDKHIKKPTSIFTSIVPISDKNQMPTAAAAAGSTDRRSKSVIHSTNVGAARNGAGQPPTPLRGSIVREQEGEESSTQDVNASRNFLDCDNSVKLPLLTRKMLHNMDEKVLHKKMF
jgi:hypothetical protein